MNYKTIARLLYCSIVFAGAFLFWFRSCEASADHLVINEVYPNPETGEVEWIELYNPTAEVIDLSVFTIEDYSITLIEKEPVNISNYASIDASGYIVLEKSIDFTFGLNNDGDTIILKDNGLIIDQVTYGKISDNAPVPSKGKSLARYPNGVDTNLDNNDFAILSETKGMENIKPSYSYDIIITEMLPEPDDGADNEYIEIFNRGAFPVDLTGWTLDDSTKGSAYVIKGDIRAGEYLAFFNLDTGISLNDSGDIVELIDPSGETKSVIKYEKAERGLSYALIETTWQWTTTLTARTANILTAKESLKERGMNDINSKQINQARELPNGDLVTTEGKVTAPPGVLSSQYFYIEDATGGIQVYLHSKDFPELKSGDWIKATGELSEVSGEKRLKINSKNDIEIIKLETPVAPKEISLEQVNEETEGQYVKITGTVSKTSGDTFYVTNGKIEVKIIIKSQTKINKPKMHKGDQVEVAGIVSQYKEEYRILPIDQDNVKIIGSMKTLPRAGTSFYIHIIISLFIILLWNTCQKVRRKLIISQKKSWLFLNRAMFLRCLEI